MGMTVEDNHGQALLNYRRKHLLQSLLPDEYVVVKDAPDIMIIENETKNRSADFRELLTLVNLCEDTVDSVKLHLPAHLADLKEIVLMNRQGEWEPVSFERVSDGAVINQPLAYCDPMYLLLK